MICYCCDKSILPEWHFCPFSGQPLRDAPSFRMGRWRKRLNGDRSIYEIATLFRQGLSFVDIAKKFGMRPLAGSEDLRFVIWMEWRNHGQWTPEGPIPEMPTDEWNKLTDLEHEAYRIKMHMYQEAWLLRYARPDPVAIEK